VTLTVTDGQASAFASLNLLVQDQPAAGTFAVEKVKLAFNFAKTGKDSISLTGKLPVTPGVDPSGKSVRGTDRLAGCCGGCEREGASGNAAFKLKLKKGAAAARLRLR